MKDHIFRFVRRYWFLLLALLIVPCFFFSTAHTKKASENEIYEYLCCRISDEVGIAQIHDISQKYNRKDHRLTVQCTADLENAFCELSENWELTFEEVNDNWVGLSSHRGASSETILKSDVSSDTWENLIYSQMQKYDYTTNNIAFIVNQADVDPAAKEALLFVTKYENFRRGAVLKRTTGRFLFKWGHYQWSISDDSLHNSLREFDSYNTQLEAEYIPIKDIRGTYEASSKYEYFSGTIAGLNNWFLESHVTGLLLNNDIDNFGTDLFLNKATYIDHTNRENTYLIDTAGMTYYLYSYDSTPAFKLVLSDYDCLYFYLDDDGLSVKNGLVAPRLTLATVDELPYDFSRLDHSDAEKIVERFELNVSDSVSTLISLERALGHIS